MATLEAIEKIERKRMLPTHLRSLSEGTALFRHWGVLTEDTVAEVLSEGYFNGVANIIEPFDRIEVTCEVGTAAPKHLLLVVTRLHSKHGAIAERMETWQVQAKKKGMRTDVPFSRAEVEPLRYEGA